MTFKLHSIYLAGVVSVIAGLNAPVVLADADGSDALHDTQWTIVEIEGNTTDHTNASPFLTFSADGSFSGKVCNSFRGTYELNQHAMTLGPAASTRMMCEKTLMQQENALFSVFEYVESYELTKDGKLHLKDKSGKSVIIARQ